MPLRRHGAPSQRKGGSLHAFPKPVWLDSASQAVGSNPSQHYAIACGSTHVTGQDLRRAGKDSAHSVLMEACRRACGHLA